MSDTILAAAARANAQAFGYDIRPGRALGMTGLDADRYFAANECDDFGVALSRGCATASKAWSVCTMLAARDAAAR